jgi:pyridoxal phosphate enzyme (YggS family)
MIADNLSRIQSTLPPSARLVAVSKLKPVEDILEAYHAGQRLFGENYATELRDKHAQLPGDIEWHFIGHLQSKQLKYYIGFVSMIHGVDSMEHLEDVEHAASKVDRVVDVLLQVHVAQEETKFGFLPEELSVASFNPAAYPHVRICGVMGMASHTDDQAHVRDDFRRIKSIFDTLKAGAFANSTAFREVSMGMSHDYPIAVEEGSTLVRIGTSIFGPRDYSKKQ